MQFSRHLRPIASLSVLAALLAPAAVYAQSTGLGGTSGGQGAAPGVSSGDAGGEAPFSGKRERRGKGQQSGQKSGGKTVRIQPYLELNQIINAELSPGSEVLTYTQAVVGVDAMIAGRNNGLSASVRYEYHQGWNKRAGHGDSVSGIVSGYTGIVPGLTLNVGGLAMRANNSSTGGAGGGVGGSSLGREGNSTIYSVQAGPSYVGRAGNLDVLANYRAGYSKIQNDGPNGNRGGVRTSVPDLFDESVTQTTDVQAGFAPGTLLPVGIGVGGSVYQENVSNLDERVRDRQVSAIVTVPVSRTVQVSGSLGYENLEVSSRDVKRGTDGQPIIRNGRYVTDKSAPRQIAYDTDGLIWDVGVSWRPSRRTSLTAHYGRRYGTSNYTGSFSWAPSTRQTLSVNVYNSVSAFGGNLGRVLDDLPEDFVAIRNPISGELGGCVSSLQGNNCVTGAFNSLRSSAFRSRGIAAMYSVRFGAIAVGLGAGYDNRKYITARGTVLEATDGTVDESYWVNANLNWTIDERSGLYTNAFANLAKSDGYNTDISNVGLTASYYRRLTNRLQANAALGIDGAMGTDDFVDFWRASALLGMRYTF